MLGRKTYTREELENGRATIFAQVDAHQRLSEAVGAGDVRPALDHFDSLFFNNLALVLDRFYVHRLRTVTGKDENPLNELEAIAESLLNNDGVFKGNNVVKYVPQNSVTGLKNGDEIRLDADQFRRLATGFFEVLEERFVTGE